MYCLVELMQQLPTSATTIIKTPLFEYTSQYLHSLARTRVLALKFGEVVGHSLHAVYVFVRLVCFGLSCHFTLQKNVHSPTIQLIMQERARVLHHTKLILSS